jgi:hypothetical protein
MTHQSLSSGQSPTTQNLPHRASGATTRPRSALRYALEAQVVFSWSGNDGLPRESRGHTRDISPKGAYVITTQCPPLGASVAMTFYLPSLTEKSQAVYVQAQARVLRVDSGRAGSAAGFSVENDRTTLCAR